MRIRSKLVALIAVPLLLLGLVALVGFRSQSTVIERAEDAAEAVEINTMIDMAVLAIGNERLALAGADVGELPDLQMITDETLINLENSPVPDQVSEATSVARARVESARGGSIRGLEELTEANDEMLRAAIGRTDDFPTAGSYTAAWLNHTAILAIEARESAWIEYLDTQRIEADEMAGSTSDRFGQSSALSSQVRDLVVATETESFDVLFRSDALRTMDGLQLRAIEDIRDDERSIDRDQILRGLIDLRGEWIAAVQEQGGTVSDLVAGELDSANGARSLATLLGFLGALVLGALVFVVYRSVTSPLERLMGQANKVAHEDLPRLIEELRYGSDIDDLPEAAPLPVTSSDEIGELVTAFNDVQITAYDLAFEQAVGRRNVADMFVNLGRRNQQLLHRILNQLTRLEQKEEDPDTLRELFELDSAVTRMRRNAESLVALAGGQTPRQWSKPVEIDNAVRGAFGEVESYERIQISSLTPARIQGNVVADLTHLLAELLENAIKFSESDTQVMVSGHHDGGDYVVTVIDEGIGMSVEELADNNSRITDPPPLERVPTRFLGLYVVGRLAERHGIGVRLGEAPKRGVMARIDIPSQLLDGEGQVTPVIDVESVETRRVDEAEASSPLDEEVDMDAELASILDDASTVDSLDPDATADDRATSADDVDEDEAAQVGADEYQAGEYQAGEDQVRPSAVVPELDAVDALPTRGRGRSNQPSSETADPASESKSDDDGRLPVRRTRTETVPTGSDGLPVRGRRRDDKKVRAGDKPEDAGLEPSRGSLEERSATDNSEKSAGDFSSMMSALSSGINRGLGESDQGVKSSSSGEDGNQEGSEG